MTTNNLDPIRILHRMSQDQSIELAGVRILWSAMVHLDAQNAPSEKIALWIEGRL
jgi:hypothetical protein